MIIKILAFGIAKDIMGGNTVNISLPTNATITSLRDLLKEQYPALEQLSSFMIACNNEYASGEELIKEADEIAIIPPVSGG